MKKERGEILKKELFVLFFALVFMVSMGAVFGNKQHMRSKDKSKL